MKCKFSHIALTTELPLKKNAKLKINKKTKQTVCQIKTTTTTKILYPKLFLVSESKQILNGKEQFLWFQEKIRKNVITV